MQLLMTENETKEDRKNLRRDKIHKKKGAWLSEKKPRRKTKELDKVYVAL